MIQIQHNLEDEKLMKTLASFNVLTYTVIDLNFYLKVEKKKWKQQDTHLGNKSQEKEFNIIFLCGKILQVNFFFRFVISHANLFHK